MSTAAEPTSHAKIVADAMIPVDDISVWKAQVEFPFSAKLAVEEALAGDSGISQRQFQDTFCSLATAFLDHQEQALGKVLIDPSTPASVLQALASMPKDALDNIRNALDAVVECPPTESQFAEIKAARESNISAAIAAAAPSKGSLTNWTIEVGEIADLQRHQESNREGGCIVADAGSDQERKVLHCGYLHWDPDSRMNRFEYLAGLPNGGTAGENKNAFEHAVKKKNAHADGHAPDSAGDMGTGLLKAIRPTRPDWHASGCMPHVFSKGSEVAFNEAFGKSKADTPGAQRLLFMVHYLAVHNKQSFYLFCKDKKNLNHDEIHVPASGEKGRWWSMFQAAGDIDRSFQLYYGYFIFKANDATESKIYRGLFRPVAKWMVNKKILAQVKFILCFHSAFWQKHFQWFLSAPKWMDNMPSNNRIGGCHAPEMVRRLIMIMRELTSLKGSFDSDTRFANWQAAVAALPSPEDRELLVLQAEVAREQFC